MEQVSPREVLQVLEKRFKERLEKARINPRFIHYVAPHFRRLRLTKKFLELGYTLYISDTSPPRGFLPLKGTKGLKALSLCGSYPQLHDFDGRIFLGMDTTVFGKRLYMELGEALPTFLPIPRNEGEDERVSMSSGELRRCLDDVRRYTRVLRRYVRVDYPPALPQEEFEAILSTIHIPDYKWVSWLGRELFTSFFIYRTHTASELREIEKLAEEREKRRENDQKMFERLPKKEKTVGNYRVYEVDVDALPKELAEKIKDVVDEAYLSPSFHQLYFPTRLGISTPRNYLLAAKILEKRGLSPHLYRLMGEHPKTMPPLVLNLITLYDDFFLFVKPKPYEQLPKQVLAKPIITPKRLILVEP